MNPKIELLMRVAGDVSVFLGKDSWVFYHGADYAYVQFDVQNINDPYTLLNLCQDLQVRFIHDENNIVIRVYVEFEE